MDRFVKVSENFILDEFLRSETALKKGFTEQYSISEPIFQNIKILAENIAEPIRKEFGGFSPTCAYRCKRLNDAVGGAKNSEHLYGKAIDETFIKNGLNINKEVFRWILKGGIKRFSTLIYEFPNKKYDPAWLHIGYDKDKLHNKILVADKRLGVTTYTTFYGSKYEKLIV